MFSCFKIPVESMKLPQLLLSVGLAGLTFTHAQSAPAIVEKDPFAPRQATASGSDGALGSGFVVFCRENPSEPGPVGEKPVWLEYCIADVADDQSSAKVENVPVADIVAQGKGEWGYIEARTNSSASGGSVYTMERAPDGRLLEANERREIGTNIYVHLFSAGDGRVSLQVCNTKFEGWVEVNRERPVQQPIYSSREITTKLTLATQWVILGGLTRSQMIRQANGAEQVIKMSSLMFIRLVSGKPVKVPQAISVSVQKPL